MNKLKLIDGWKNAWKYVSVQLAAVLVFLPELLPYMGDVALYIPSNYVQILGAAILVARIVQQKSLTKKECPKEA